jgi:hypothetical protein
LLPRFFLPLELTLTLGGAFLGGCARPKTEGGIGHCEPLQAIICGRSRYMHSDVLCATVTTGRRQRPTANVANSVFRRLSIVFEGGPLFLSVDGIECQCNRLKAECSSHKAKEKERAF